jgi:BlaI family penicillinase repressor
VLRKHIYLHLTRRERQIMDVIYMLGRATAAEIHARMPDHISDASLRKLVRILEGKGFLTHEREGREHVYRPTVPREKIRTEAAQHLLQTMFQGSVSAAVSALIDASDAPLSDEDAAELRRLIDEAEMEGR